MSYHHLSIGRVNTNLVQGELRQQASYRESKHNLSTGIAKTTTLVQGELTQP